MVNRLPVSMLDLSIAACSFSLFLANEFICKKLTADLFVHSYVNDVVGMGILLPFCNTIVRFHRQHHLLFVRPSRIFGLSLAAGIFWEFVTPLYKTASVTDLYDVIAYLLGGMGYFLCVRTARCASETHDQKIEHTY